jgi:hypothetical protein
MRKKLIQAVIIGSATLTVSIAQARTCFNKGEDLFIAEHGFNTPLLAAN